MDSTQSSDQSHAVQKAPTRDEVMKVPCGIPALDESLGGLPERSIILILGDTESGLNVCAQQILFHGLSAGRSGVYFTSSRPSGDVTQEMKLYGWDLTAYVEKGLATFIDAFSSKLGRVPGQVSWDIGPANMFAKEFPPIVKRLGSITLVLDSVTDLAKSTAFRNVEGVIKNLQLTVRTLGGVYLLLAHRGVHTEQELNSLRHLSDGVIELSTEPFGSEEFAKRMKIAKMPWSISEAKLYAFRLGPGGIEMAALHRIK